MNTATIAIKSSLGRKYLMAASGLILYGFVIVHMLGNLQVFLGPEPLNAYAAFLKSKPGLLWGFRFVLLLMAVVHIWTSIQLSLENRAARRDRYGKYNPTVATYASRSMLLSGLMLFAFIAYHLMHFTIGVTNPEFLQLRDELGRHDVYRMTIVGFSRPAVSAFYIAAMCLLCLHLSHGFGSLFQSLGLKNQMRVARVSQVLAIIILLGNISMPLAVLAGWVR
ncbi:MAG: succinate dehydrogenase cytochrome b subunit [Acidobacteriota bacterium]